MGETVEFNIFKPSTYTWDGAKGALWDTTKGMFGTKNADGEYELDWKKVGTVGSIAYSTYTAITAYGDAKAAGDKAAEAAALQEMLAITNKDLALAGFQLQKDAFNASLAIEATKMGYWEEAQTLNKTVAETKFKWYKKLQPFALDKEKYDEALRTNNLDVLEAQTAHVQEVLLNSGDELDSIYKDQSQLYADERTSLDDYETRVLGAIDRIGEREQITNESIMGDYNQLYDQNMGELNNLIDRVNTRGYAENYDNGMNRSTLENDRSRDLTKKYYDEVMKTKNVSYDQAIARNTSKDALYGSNRAGILTEAGNTSILDAYTKALSDGNTLMSNATSVKQADYDFANALNQLKNGGMVSSAGAGPATLNVASGNGTAYNGNTSSLLSNANSGANSLLTAYSGAATANAKTSGGAAADVFDLVTGTAAQKAAAAKLEEDKKKGTS